MSCPILPIDITFEEWTAQLSANLSDVGVPLPMHEKDWREWAQGVLDINGNLVGNLPQPDKLAFPHDSDWRAWAAYFVQTVFNL